MEKYGGVKATNHRSNCSDLDDLLTIVQCFCHLAEYGAYAVFAVGNGEPQVSILKHDL